MERENGKNVVDKKINRKIKRKIVIKQGNLYI
jgi:hypothetical protein